MAAAGLFASTERHLNSSRLALLNQAAGRLALCGAVQSLARTQEDSFGHGKDHPARMQGPTYSFHYHTARAETMITGRVLGCPLEMLQFRRTMSHAVTSRQLHMPSDCLGKARILCGNS